jgi:hypothetical protein
VFLPPLRSASHRPLVTSPDPLRYSRAGSVDSLDSLIQAKKLAEQMGGIAQARAALDALERILA